MILRLEQKKFIFRVSLRILFGMVVKRHFSLGETAAIPPEKFFIFHFESCESEPYQNISLKPFIACSKGSV
jgi:hypothetical protein